MNINLKQILSNNAISLNSIGSFSFAYAKEDALILVAKLFVLGIPILGGEVLFSNTEQRFKFDGAWGINREQNESDEDYLKKTYINTIIYISKFDVLDDKKQYVFEITPAIPVDEWKEMFGDVFGFDKVDSPLK